MAAETVRRETESAAIAEFLDTAATEPSGLVIDGERGIGKTTLWLDGVEQARRRGWAVLATRPVEAESVLAYASLADLLGGVDAAEFTHLPAPQQVAIDRVLLRGDAADAATDPRAVAAAFRSVVDGLAAVGPVLIAVDDLQWIDRSSAAAVAFAARRLSGPVGVFATLRTDLDSSIDASWLSLPRPDAIERLMLGPLSLGALHIVLSERLKRSIPRRRMVRIHEVSAGNPFYALELGRAMSDDHADDDTSLPPTLSDLVRARIGGLDPAVQDILLAAACAAAPTVELVALATDTPASRVVEIMADAEATGIIRYEGERLRFGHPLLAAGVYGDTPAFLRRAMHRRLADVVTEPELRARHLAHAATTGDAHTLQALDAAAITARSRGAPAAAAELLDLAIGLGGDTVGRRIRAAEHHFHATNFAEASSRLERIIETSGSGEARADALRVLADVRTAEENFDEMVTVLKRVLTESADDLELRVRSLVLLSYAQLNIVEWDEAAHNIDEAVELATRLGRPELLSQALAFQTMLRFCAGHGFDEATMALALELEDPSTDIPLGVQASPQNAILLAWTGQLARGYEALKAVRQRALDRGQEHELAIIDAHCTWIALWRGALADAALLAEDALERARAMDNPHPLFAALTMQAGVAAYGGQEHRARDAIAEALAQAQRFGAPPTTRYTIATLGFLELSLGNHAAALSTLEPLLALIDAAPMALEIVVAMFVPDAAEALVAMDRLDDAEHLIGRFESDGRRLDRAWMLACGGRCRAMLLAAHGDVDAASLTVQQAMVEHDRLPMPFERARTQLLLGQLQRRQRRKEGAANNFREALATFESLGTPLWAERARAELARTNVGPRRATMLTPAEQRVAELAASGMTNRDVAAELFISPKTVEGNLARIYQKLGIRSRAELGQRMNQPDA